MIMFLTGVIAYFHKHTSIEVPQTLINYAVRGDITGKLTEGMEYKEITSEVNYLFIHDFVLVPTIAALYLMAALMYLHRWGIIQLNLT
jgi:hypothetical protein